MTISGLILCFAMHATKLAIDFPMVLLDELSGKLNEGTAENDMNYVQLLADILQHASKSAQIVIIDHRLHNDVFDNIINVVKDKVTNVSYIN